MTVTRNVVQRMERWAVAAALCGAAACGPGSATPPPPAVRAVAAAPGGESGGPPADPCGGVPLAGVCTDPATLSMCVAPTGDAQPRVTTVRCAQGEACQTKDGRAQCVLTATCREGQSRCQGDQVVACRGGNWVPDEPQPCANGCSTSAIGAYCSPVPAAQTEPFAGHLSFAAREPNADRTDWSATPVTRPARGFLVASRMPDPSDPTKHAVIDVVYSGESPADAGAFSVKVRSAAQRSPDDDLVVAAVADDGTGDIAYALADPQLGAGEHKAGAEVPTTPALWSWTAKLQSLSNGELVIPMNAGSAAASRYDGMRAAHQRAFARYGGTGSPLIVWMSLGATWDCGACFGPAPASAFATQFQGQIFFGENDEDQEEWANATTVHENGHWVMESFGRDPNEGGPHITSVPTLPGQAWSEGWATFFSSEVRADPVYLDKQQGTMFWFDLGGRRYSDLPWERPTPGGGLLQRMDENELAATLWALSRAGQASTPLYDALASPHMKTPPFKRGYTRHTWDVDARGHITDVVDTGQPAPALPDLLDALMCAGFSRSELDAATEPAAHYPYPSDDPLCP